MKDRGGREKGKKTVSSSQIVAFPLKWVSVAAKLIIAGQGQTHANGTGTYALQWQSGEGVKILTAASPLPACLTVMYANVLERPEATQVKQRDTVEGGGGLGSTVWEETVAPSHPSPPEAF